MYASLKKIRTVTRGETKIQSKFLFYDYIMPTLLLVVFSLGFLVDVAFWNSHKVKAELALAVKALAYTSQCI